MNSIMIIKPDGTKYPATREQLLQLAKSGVITPDTKVEVLGRIVSARKIQELASIFKARGAQAEERMTDSTSIPSSDEESTFTPFPEPPKNDVPPGNESSQSNTEEDPSYIERAVQAFDDWVNETPFPAILRTDEVAEMVDEKNTSIDTRTPPLEERVHARTAAVLRPLVIMRVLSTVMLWLTPIASFAVAGCSDDPSFLILGVFVCLGLYFLSGFIRVIIFYVSQRSGDSIRQEDFNRDVMQQLREIKERLK